MFAILTSGFARDEQDSLVVRSEKTTIFLIAISCSIAGVLWGIAYGVILGWGLTALLPFLFSVVVGSSLAVSQASRNHY